MAAGFDGAFEALRAVLKPFEDSLSVLADRDSEYTLVTKSAPKAPPHKGKPLWFGSVRKGKAYVSFHLMPLYSSEELAARVSPDLKQRMQGKQCFNFKAAPEAGLLDELRGLAGAGFEDYREKCWL